MLNLRKIPTSLSFAVLALLSACGHKRDPDQPARERRPPITGPLAQSLNELQGSQDIESCDTGLKDKEREIVDALDSRADAIIKFAESLPPRQESNTDFTRVEIQDGFTVKVAKNPSAPTEGWQSFEYGWPYLIDLYNKIKNKPVDANWIALNSGVRSVLTNDQMRILDGANLYLDQDTREDLESLETAIVACDSDPTCTKPSLSKELVGFTALQPFYWYYYEALMKAETSSEKRELIGRFRKRVRADLENTYELTINSSVERGDENTLTVPLDGTAFTDGLTKVQEFIETPWKGEKLTVKVAWRTRENEKSLFKIFLEKELGTRSYVQYDNQSVHLFPEVKAKSIAHEFGHVLGFPDHYYTTWDPDRCLYSQHQTETDIMSDPLHGAVTADEMDELRRRYPVSATSDGDI